MPDFQFTCPQCEQTLEVPGELLGTVIECPSCHTAIQLPEAEGTRAPEAPPQQPAEPEPSPETPEPPTAPAAPPAPEPAAEQPKAAPSDDSAAAPPKKKQPVKKMKKKPGKSAQMHAIAQKAGAQQAAAQKRAATKRSKAPLIVTLILMIVVGAAGWFFLVGPGKELISLTQTTVVGTANAYIYSGEEPPDIVGRMIFGGSLDFAEPAEGVGTFEVVSEDGFPPHQPGESHSIQKGAIVSFAAGGGLSIDAGIMNCWHSVPPSATISGGTEVKVEREQIKWLVVSTEEGKKGWIRRADLCTLSEYERRSAEKQVPVSVTEIRAVDDELILCGGPIAIRKNEAAVEEGQAFYIDATTESHNITLAGKQAPPRADAVWYIGPMGGSAEFASIPISINCEYVVAAEEEDVPEAVFPDRPDKALYADHQFTAASWRQIGPSVPPMAACDIGEISEYPNHIRKFNKAKTPSMGAARKIAADPKFIYDNGSQKYSLWGVLQRLEGSSDPDSGQAPHFLYPSGTPMAYVWDKYGEPDHVGFFDRTGSDEVVTLEVHWYGTIFFMVDAADKITSIGGWPSWL